MAGQDYPNTYRNFVEMFPDGKIFDKSRAALKTWFEIAWQIINVKNGKPAKTLEHTLGVNFRIAWRMLQRFRGAMVNAERKPLFGEVEVDETIIGGREKCGNRGRGTSKSLVLIAVKMKQPNGFGCVRMLYAPNASSSRSCMLF